MLADLAGYTALTEAHGGASAAQLVRKYVQLVDSALVGSARLFQRIGDQVVILSDSASDMLNTALRLNKMTGDEHHFLSIHSGLHYGPVFMDGNSLYGSTINVAARIMNIAQRGEILCSQSFISQLPELTDVKSVGKYKLKNIAEECELFLINESIQDVFLIDPVCHMQIDVFKSNLTADYNEVTYHFCSIDCRERFNAAPDQFIINGK